MIDALKPSVEPLLEALGLPWVEVLPVLQKSVGLDELRSSLSRPRLFVCRLAGADVAQVGRSRSAQCVWMPAHAEEGRRWAAAALPTLHAAVSVPMEGLATHDITKPGGRVRGWERHPDLHTRIVAVHERLESVLPNLPAIEFGEGEFSLFHEQPPGTNLQEERLVISPSYASCARPGMGYHNGWIIDDMG